jgi:hypothetical protein
MPGMQELAVERIELELKKAMRDKRSGARLLTA